MSFCATPIEEMEVFVEIFVEKVDDNMDAHQNNHSNAKMFERGSGARQMTIPASTTSRY